MPETTYMEAIRNAMAEEMRRNPKVFLMGEDIGMHGGAFGVTKGLLEEFGAERVRDTPISENAFIGAALGAALAGSRPIVEIMFGDFALLAADQIINQIAKVRYMFGGQCSVPLVIRLPQGGLSWKSAGAQHSQSFEALYAHTPGLKVVLPSSPDDAKGLMKSAIRENNPVIFIEHKALYSCKGQIPESEYLVPIGRASVKRNGKDATVVASGYMVHSALEAAEKLLEKNIDIEVIDPRTISPLDESAIFASVRKTNHAIIVHEDHRSCGIGAEWGMRIYENCFDWLDAPIVRLCGADTPIPFSDSLERHIWPRSEDIYKAVLRCLNRE